jgi:hypothetical protein
MFRRNVSIILRNHKAPKPETTPTSQRTMTATLASFTALGACLLTSELTLMDSCWRRICLGVWSGMILFPLSFLCRLSSGCYYPRRETAPGVDSVVSRRPTYLLGIREIVISVTTIAFKIMTIWIMVSCSLLHDCQSFRGTSLPSSV